MNELSELNIAVENVSKSFGNTLALENVTTLFQAGRIHGIIGPEGAGKTTLMRTLLGLLNPTQGRIVFKAKGQTIPFQDIRPVLAYMPQQQSLYADLSINEHLQFFKSMYGLSDPHFKERSQTLLNLTRLAPFLERPAGKLSGGMYKKLGLMCALLYSPKILILDEPTNGVDPVSRRELWELLYQFSNQDMLILISTAYMDEAERCGEVHLLQNGHSLAQGEPKNSSGELSRKIV